MQRGLVGSEMCIRDRYVPFAKRAWHAGVSSFAGRAGCNDYSIGIELEGTVKSAYSEAQYQALACLTAEIQKHYPAVTADRITGHSNIAPQRKSDPGEQFDWRYYLGLLAEKSQPANVLSIKRYFQSFADSRQEQKSH
eukprot:TRINITY_DN25981_c0_g1_i1.p1 TRINITY_DN25981_c0_g1~~TRINITY_DN25981_c0_g1_i1.p1  ORF type:complete len:138 (+),score=21.17 TRINITY_DN25981_c0_g1_i1:134-547(+)